MSGPAPSDSTNGPTANPSPPASITSQVGGIQATTLFSGTSQVGGIRATTHSSISRSCAHACGGARSPRSTWYVPKLPP